MFRTKQNTSKYQCQRSYNHHCPKRKKKWGHHTTPFSHRHPSNDGFPAHSNGHRRCFHGNLVPAGSALSHDGVLQLNNALWVVATFQATRHDSGGWTCSCQRVSLQFGREVDNLSKNVLQKMCIAGWYLCLPVAPLLFLAWKTFRLVIGEKDRVAFKKGSCSKWSRININVSTY